jgi:hypothetical protein
MNFPSGNHLGLIAQEVEEVLPELVNTDDDGYKSVEYANLVAVLIEAIKEQQSMLSELRAELDEVKSTMSTQATTPVPDDQHVSE